MKPSKLHKHNFTYPSGNEQTPLIVSGYGLTEYMILFCIDCGELVWKMTKDIEGLYPKQMQRRPE